MVWFPERDETDNGYESEDEQKKDNVAYAKGAWFLLVVFVVVGIIAYLE
jgi:hypothetical protein